MYEVTAEGIETAEHLQFVRALGCEGAQGWYVGEPQLGNIGESEKRAVPKL